MFLTGFTSFSVLLLFPLSITFFVFVHDFDSSLSNIDEVLNPYANVFVFGDFNVHHIDWLTYSSGTDRSGELCCDFSIPNDLTHIVVSVNTDFPSFYSQWDVLFHHIAHDYFCANLDGFCGHLRDVLLEDIFKLSDSAAAQ